MRSAGLILSQFHLDRSADALASTAANGNPSRAWLATCRLDKLAHEVENKF